MIIFEWSNTFSPELPVTRLQREQSPFTFGPLPFGVNTSSRLSHRWADSWSFSPATFAGMGIICNIFGKTLLF